MSSVMFRFILCLLRGTGLPTRDRASHGSGDPCHFKTEAGISGCGFQPQDLLILLLSVLLLSGCASFQTDAPSDGGLTGVQRFFVVSNLSDNHALDQRIVAALRTRGLVAESGPLTMMPGDTQAVVAYQDHWNWDFGEHLVYLKITVRKPESNEPLAGASFSARIPRKETTAETVAHLVARLFSEKAK